MRRPILMVGTHLDGRGGVATVLRTWREQGLFERCGIQYLATNGHGNRAHKAMLAIGAWWRCLVDLSIGRVQLIHVHTSSYASFWRKTPVMLIAMLVQQPLIVSLHGGAFREFYAGCGVVGRSWIRLVMRRAIRFVVLTPAWREWVLKIEPASRVEVIPNPAPEVPPWPIAARGFSPLPTALYLGRIEDAKGIDVLLDALAAAHESGARWRLVCGGVGEIDRARQRCTQLGLPETAVHFAGWVDGDQKRQLLRDCDLLVLPSRIENMPVVVLEAFAYGKPVVATAVGGIPDLVTNGVDGFLVAAGDAKALAHHLVALHGQADELARLGRAGRQKVDSRYAPAIVVAQVEALYRDCSTDLG
jgi:glycosyltransferase involved in cell wall biosynthesis